CANLDLHEHENLKISGLETNKLLMLDENNNVVVTEIENKEYLDNIDQNLNTDCNVKFNNLKIKNEIKLGDDDDHTNKITTYNDCLAIIGKDHDSYKINIGYYVNDDKEKAFIPKISMDLDGINQLLNTQSSVLFHNLNLRSTFNFIRYSDDKIIAVFRFLGKDFIYQLYERLGIFQGTI